MKGYVFLNIDSFVVAWEVHCGILISTNETITNSVRPMSVFEASKFRKNHVMWYENELIIDEIRKQNHPSKISRLTGMYFLEDRESALRVTKDPRWEDKYFDEEFLSEVDLLPSGEITKVDTNWIFENNVMKKHIDKNNMEWIDKYWKGEPMPTQTPLWELIMEGSAVILNESLKTKSFEIIKNRQPKTLPLLEKSRIERQRGSQYGHIVSWVMPIEDAKKGKVVYIIKGVEKNQLYFCPDLMNESFNISVKSS